MGGYAGPGTEENIRGPQAPTFQELLDMERDELANHYQTMAGITDSHREKFGDNDLLLLVLGFAGEAGELAGKVYKVYRDNGGVITEETRELIALEIGDSCWFLARIAARLGVRLGAVLVMNIIKLADRAARGALHGNGDKR